MLLVAAIGWAMYGTARAQAHEEPSGLTTEEPAGAFGIESFSTSVSTTQAGAHPDASTLIQFASHLNSEGVTKPNEGPHNLTVEIPPGLIGNLNAVPSCATVVFDAKAGESECPDDTQVGISSVRFALGSHPNEYLKLPVVLLEHGASEVARLGVEGPIPTVIDITVRTGTDYGITASVPALTPENILSVGLTLWGMPAQHERGCRGHATVEYIGDLAISSCSPTTPPSPSSQWVPFLTNPTSCAGGPLITTLSADGNQEPERYVTASAEQPQPTGCEGLAFDPSIATSPINAEADAPSGYTFDLAVPQNAAAEGFASSELREAVVTLPAGMTLDPSAATGLQACSNEQFGMGSTAPPSCPSGSVIGTDEVVSPDVPQPLSGQVYVGQPEPGNMYRVFQDIEGDGLDVKLEGRASPNPVTGQITATFGNLPPLPFSNFKLRLKGGNTAVLASPPTCGADATTTELTPWSGNADATPASALEVSSDGVGGVCPSLWPLAPSFSAGSNLLAAGASTTFSLTLSRGDRTQYFGGLGVHLPPGLVGNLTDLPLCGAAQAAAGTCPADTEIGTVSTEAGVGETPFALTGTVYLAEPRIPNSPASLSIVVPAVAGPYNLGNVVVGAGIRIYDDGSVAVNSDPLPTILDGVPLRLRQIAVDITRPGFMRNPTSCAPASVTATVLSTRWESAGVSSPFQLADCKSLPFSPKLTASTQAKTTKVGGASLDVNVESGPGQANIAKVDVSLPKQLPSRLTTLQKACTESQFAADPAGCPAGSVVGTATARTPLLNQPLTGPAILVSHGGVAFPDLELVLQGDGITIVLTGDTEIKKGVTYSKFETVPDVPISTFALKLPEGPDSVLATDLPLKAKYNMCGQALTMPTTLIGQNGDEITQSTKIAVTQCPKTKTKKSKSKKPKSSHAKAKGKR
jgi:hypothetical protein